MSEIIDQESQSSKKSYRLLYRIVTSIGFIYIIYCFSRYYFIKENLDSPLLPAYTTGLIFGQQALQGFIASIGLFIGQLFHWNKKNIVAIIIILFGLILAKYIHLILFLLAGE
ncbi:MAG: hypothetical protein COA33_010260 [Fluviicola sp.]|nr:hypothetical protein [Fluviicola sp.]